MRIEVRTVGMPKGGGAPEANADVSTETDQKPIEIDLPDWATVDDLLQRAREMGIPVDQLNAILLDGSHVDESTPLRDGAAVTLIGPVQGE